MGWLANSSSMDDVEEASPMLASLAVPLLGMVVPPACNVYLSLRAQVERSIEEAAPEDKPRAWHVMNLLVQCDVGPELAPLFSLV